MLKAMELRSNLYKFLSQMYLMELDAALLAELKQMEFPELCENEYLATGYSQIEKALVAMTAEDLDDLAVDYAKTFLAAGSAQGSAAFPYESVYTSRRRLVGQEVHDSVVKFYAEHGMKLGAPVFKIPEDHISVEFEFMAHLCGKWISAETDEEKAENLKVQKEFFRSHIINWAVMFCADAERHAETDFYCGLANITRGFLQEEKGLLNRI